MPYRNRKPTYGSFILIFVAIKVLLNLLAIAHFGFHRDELLHLALGDHLSWGYKEVPPFIGLLAAVVTHVLGGSLVATRIFPTIFTGLLVWFTGQLTVEFGGRRLAIAIACLTLIVSPAFVASNYLFQPVIFDQFWWTLAVWLLVKYINTRENRYLYWLGFAVGVGILTKYTMVFFAGALVIGLLFSKHRKILISKAFFMSVLIAFVIILPNIVWQLSHHIPAITHMQTLQKQQLDYNDPADFAIQQLLVNGIGIIVWVTGFICLFASYKLRRFMFLGIAYLVVFLFLLKMNGKAYYLFPAYPMLFAAGAYMIARMLKKTSIKALRVAAVALLTLPNLILLPIVLPVLPLQQTVGYIGTVEKHTHSLKFAVTWEDHRQHPLTQDYADMLGWDEMVAKASKVYLSLPENEKSKTVIFTDNYGEAAAFFHYAGRYPLPQIVSLNSSFALWAPEQLNCRNIIYISDDHDVSDLVPLTQKTTKEGEVSNPLARERGTAIFLLRGLNPKLEQVYEEHLKLTRQ